jgi:hypothetical protein
VRPTSTSTLTRQAADDDVKEGQDPVDDGEDDGRNAMHNGHEYGADGLEDAFDLGLLVI